MPHIHDQIDFTAEVFIVFQGKVLLRKHDKYKKWLAVGGHIELDEDPIQAAIREAKEEVGLDVVILGQPPKVKEAGNEFSSLVPPKFMNRHRINDRHEHITMIYFGTSQTDQVVAGGSDRSNEWKWFSREELDDPSLDTWQSIRHYAKAALDTVGAS